MTPVKNYVRMTPVKNQVRDQVFYQVYNRARYQVRNQVFDYLVWNQVENHVWLQVRSQFKSKMQ
jgi:hypothetical protein